MEESARPGRTFAVVSRGNRGNDFGLQFTAHAAHSADATAQGALDMWRAYNQGLDTAEPRTPDSSTPTTFRQWCEEFLKPRVLANAA